MTIAFIVVAAVAFIFLLVFNTKMVRKSSPKTVSPSNEDSRQRSKRPYPVEVEPKARELPEPESTRETRHKAAEAEVHHKEPVADSSTKPMRDSVDTKDSYGDQDYRAALRGFAGKEDKEELHKHNHGERETHKSEDEQYREALRSMNRKK
ncbi:hypothetical protein ACWHAM_09750 [Paenibacillus terrae]